MRKGSTQLEATKPTNTSGTKSTKSKEGRKASVQLDTRLGTANSTIASGRSTRITGDDSYPTPPSTGYSKVR